ncbi:MAG: hypothetical protein IT208_13135 [Chthonomonadales bacterium]|nr:hypothetical protein [Chthonomonadales bacterium]
MKSSMWRGLACGLALLAATMAPASAAGPNLVASTDKLGYTLTLDRYNTLADAQAAGAPVAQFVLGAVDPGFPVHDGALYLVNDVPGVSANYNILMSAWYYTIDPGHGPYSGWGNPSNTNTGFVQLYDDDSSTISSLAGGWTDTSYDTFVLNLSGANAGAADYARLWYGGIGGAGELTRGTFIEYALDMTFSGITGAALDPGLGLVVSNDHPGSVSGTFSGIFENQSATNPSLNGFYRFSAAFSDSSWAYAQAGALNGAFNPSMFAAAAVVPEPGAAHLLLLAAATGAGWLWRVRRAR